MKTELLPIKSIKGNPKNPRIIKDDKFKTLVKSLQDFPEMANVRPVVCNTDMVILGGNMRWKAAIEAGWKEIPVQIVDWSEEKQQEFIIKDNVSGGEWNWDDLANEWDVDLLGEWGLDLPIVEEALLPELESEESEIVQMTFTLSKEMESIIKTALDKCRESNEVFEDGVCENANGIALAGVCKKYVS